ncbi:CLASP N terminal [Musa troglodytarum]|uniref:CLASP N terminal n=1 Tax=Musa troglodytarum TaxID=320322 RepID=A0A9E7KTX3_9LILI|nr:CLASP N terminal [Musa troglodytarum]
MALRSLDNALPTSMERPRKVAKVATPPPPAAAKKPAPAALPPDSRVSEEKAPPPPAVEQSVEYVASEELKPLSDPHTKLAVLLDELSSEDWMSVCQALNDLRRMALHHSSYLVPILGNVAEVIVKAMKSPRSALCKTSIMASTDIFHSFGHLLLSTTEENAFDQLLLQLLLKASQDKRFVCEEAEKAIEKMAISTSPLPLLKKLQSYVHHANLRVRAKAAVAMSKCVSKMGIEVMKEFGLAALLQMAAELLNDRLPEAREAARSMIYSIYGEFSKDSGLKNDDDASSAAESWQNLCSSSLAPIAAQLVAKIVSL